MGLLATFVLPGFGTYGAVSSCKGLAYMQNNISGTYGAEWDCWQILFYRASCKGLAFLPLIWSEI